MSAAQQLRLSWSEPGPVAGAFMRNEAEIVGINGPVGSGKTTAAIMKGVRKASEQRPSLLHTAPGPGTSDRWPVRRVRQCVVRDTYRQLWRSTMPSWFSRFPKDIGNFTGAENAPASHVITFALRDRTLVEMQTDFLAIGDNGVEDVLRGYEPTWFYLNEMDMLAQEVFTYAIGRYGRFPAMEDGGPTWQGILFDCNAPELDSWIYEDMFLSSPADLRTRNIALYRQPGGMDPAAENLSNLPGGRAYYERQIANAPDWYVQRMVHNRAGYSRSGKPVYAEFNDTLHVAPVDHPGVPALPLIVGLDAGMQPAATFSQRLPSGLWLTLDELVSEPGTGPRRFGQALAQRLQERFPGFTTVIGICDPSALYGADKKAGEKDWSEIVGAEAGITIRPAPTNDPVSRWEAVRRPLSMLIDGRPAFQLNPRCRVLRSGFNAAYRFRKIAGTTNRFNTDQAEKTAESHPHDALQYGMSWGGEDVAIRQRRGEERQRADRLPAFSPPFDPYAHAAGG
jgi:hypothetical protein